MEEADQQVEEISRGLQLQKIDKPHTVCRLNRKMDDVVKFKVPNYYVPWYELYPEYDPPDYTSPKAIGKSWSDPVLSSDINLQELMENDQMVDRTSESGYGFMDGRPCNPCGRTGLKGRGVLGRWGPNRSVTILFTRFKTERNGSECLNLHSKKPILQFVAIYNTINKIWNLPFAMLKPGEDARKVLPRELVLRAFFNESNGNASQRQSMYQSVAMHYLDNLNVSIIYKGYMNDGRNTDNAWVETICKNYHDGKTFLSMLRDDFFFNRSITNIVWKDIDESVPVNLGQMKFLKLVAKRQLAHWSKEVHNHSSDESESD